MLLAIFFGIIELQTGICRCGLLVWLWLQNYKQLFVEQN